MKENIKLQIMLSKGKVLNISQQVNDIEAKISKLKDHLETLEKSVEDELNFIAEIGQKTPRRDGKPETAEELSKKSAFNQNLQTEKLQLFESEPVIYRPLQGKFGLG